MAYARDTQVSVARTKAEIEDLLTRAGATEFGTMANESLAQIGFSIPTGDGVVTLRVRVSLPLPDKNENRFKKSPKGRVNYDMEQRHKAWEQACRANWRALLLVIKAKIEAVEVGISTLEREFLPDVLLPSGQTVEQTVGENLGRQLAEGNVRPLLTAR